MPSSVSTGGVLFWWSFLHPQKLTWNLEMMVSNRNLLFQGSIFRFHVCFGGCKRNWFENFFVLVIWRKSKSWVMLRFSSNHQLYELPDDSTRGSARRFCRWFDECWTKQAGGFLSSLSFHDFSKSKRHHHAVPSENSFWQHVKNWLIYRHLSFKNSKMNFG